MARVIPVGEPANEAERLAIGFLRDHLPEGYLLLHNFEIHRDGGSFETDLAIVAPHAVYLVDVKGTRGNIDVHGPHWYPEGRAPFGSPLLKLRQHARVLKGIITASHPSKIELERVFVTAVILLTSPDAALHDPENRDGPDVVALDKAPAFFLKTGRIPAKFDTNILPHQNIILKAIQGVAKKRSGPLRFGNWEVTEKLGGTDSFTEYRAFNHFAGRSSGPVLLRSYRADPYLPPDLREAQRRRIANAYEALNRLPSHPSIIAARDFFGSESGDTYILVTEDIHGQALRIHLDKPQHVLTVDQKRRITADLLSALAHAHRHQVIHRNLTPSCILVRPDGGIALGGFDYARSGQDRSRTIAREIVDELDERYVAPEVNREPQAASPASDVFSAGLILYELFTGERPFKNQSEIFDLSGAFPQKPSSLRNELSAGFDAWLQKLCSFEPAARPSAEAALEAFESHDAPAVAKQPAEELKPAPATETPAPDYLNLPANFPLTQKFVVRNRLGKPGTFGVVYKVVDTLGDISRAVKIIVHDRISTLDRLKKEYRTLLHLPEHPHVVRVFDADFLPGSGPPFIVFEFVDGLDVGEMIEEGCFSADDALVFARQMLQGIGHLHRHGVFHCDIKPRNLIWTSRGVKIIDFNVSVRPAAENGHGGGSRRYLPPDLDVSGEPATGDLCDRDLYAFGLTLFEVVTGRYPWDADVPPVGRPAPDPRTWSDCADLAPEAVVFLAKALAPLRADRFRSAEEMEAALRNVPCFRLRPAVPTAGAVDTETLIGRAGAGQANANPFVSYLLTLFSQSSRSNSGTRGLDELGRKIYVETALDRELTPAVLSGAFGLVIITGNAGDGKTAFLQQLEEFARRQGGSVEPAFLNGSRFRHGGRQFLCLYDGSQDEGDRSNDRVLSEFFAPYAGETDASWPTDEVRLIAINEGRLIDFLAGVRSSFPLLSGIVTRGLASGVPEHRTAIVNLNLRSIVGGMAGAGGSILRRLMERMIQPKLWEPCRACDLADRCYIHHNICTFRDPTAGPKVLERLETLFTLAHLRGRLHITMRDLRSALAFMLVGMHDCAGVHELYRTGDRERILGGFYFNSWLGGDRPTADRLLSLLAEIDVGKAADPRLDRNVDFLAPAESKHLFSFEGRGRFDLELLARVFAELPRECGGSPAPHHARSHRGYVAVMRRKEFFERRDGGWRGLLPYRSAERLLKIIETRQASADVLRDILDGINRGEGLYHPARLGGSLALQVRNVENGTIRSYRLFPADRFSLAVDDQSARASFVEHVPRGLMLRYQGDDGLSAELEINLDVFEMLTRLNAGYRPSLEEEQGYYLSLAVFKNLLGAAPYKEVLLTTTGHEFYRIRSLQEHRLELSRMGGTEDSCR